MTKPKPGDRVRVTYEGKVDTTGLPHVWGGDNTGWVGITKDATVEVIEPADDPSKDPVGTVRRRTDRSRSRPVIRQEGARPWRTLAGTYYTDAEVVGWEKLAPVEGTPAAAPRARYFQEGNYAHTCWRVLPSGAVDYRYGGNLWMSSGRFSSLDQLLEADEIVEVPAP